MKAILLIVLLTLLAVVVNGGAIHRYLASGPVGWQIRKMVRDDGATRIRLADATAFAWTDVYLFSPYSLRQSVCGTLQLKGSACSAVLKDAWIDEGQVLLVFRHHGRIVHAERHLRHHGDFTPVPAGQPLRVDEAVFRTEARGQDHAGVPWIALQHQAAVAAQ
ncbi:hypothetical protein N8I74_00385 [Chitiniphilus purpureus]|uniref:Uncharacterized protein n=1 Tax=Chitiniphilus purpureus TaxID=2981137 RepID=A0ABY6DUH1_9NEIS|nr:hypothetical protein [Chitiniphilus sp. CD1]UXY15508.1 hypothetical protein N8I74_00385 [Chitiniphilus sp. CD1]